MSFKSKLIFSLLVSTAAISIANAQHDGKESLSERNDLPRVVSSHSSFGGLEDVTEEFVAKEEAKNLEQAIGGLKSQAQKYIADGKSEDDVLAIGQNIASLTEQLFAIREKFEGGKLVNAHRQVSQSSVDELLKEKNALSKSTSSIEKGHEDSLEATSLKKSKSETIGDKFMSLFSGKTSQVQKTEDLKSPKSVTVKAVSQKSQDALVIEDGFDVIDLDSPSTFSFTPESQSTTNSTFDEGFDDLDSLLLETEKRNPAKKEQQPEALRSKAGKQQRVQVAQRDKVQEATKSKKNPAAKALPLSFKGKIVHVKDNSAVVQEEVLKSTKDEAPSLRLKKANAAKALPRLERKISSQVEVVAVENTPLGNSAQEEILTQNEIVPTAVNSSQVISSQPTLLSEVITKAEPVPTPAKIAESSSFFEQIKESKPYAYLADKKEKFVKFTAPIRARFNTVIEKAKGTTAFQIFKGLFN